jgi:peptidoglycan/xylan/chitin deacetylase (PgdA/CDA1 family)
VKATYFLVGMQAEAYPWLVRRIFNDGQTIGTHSEHHPFRFNSMPLPRIESEVDGGIAAVTKAVGDPRAVSPFFRIPGLAHGPRVETFLASQKLAVWSADEVADDWRHGVTAADIVRLAINRIDAKGHRGVLLLHDIHPATALALPNLLKELKERGYHIVQVVAPGERPKSVPLLPEPAVLAKLDRWPRLPEASHAKMAAHHRSKALSARRHHHHHRHEQASARRVHKAHHAALEQKNKRF